MIQLELLIKLVKFLHLASCKWLYVSIIFFYFYLLELCENLPIVGRETIIMNQVLPYIKVNLTLVYFWFYFALCEGKPYLGFFVCLFYLKLFEFKGGQGMNGIDVLMWTLLCITY